MNPFTTFKGKLEWTRWDTGMWYEFLLFSVYPNRALCAPCVPLKALLACSPAAKNQTKFSLCGHIYEYLNITCTCRICTRSVKSRFQHLTNDKSPAFGYHTTASSKCHKCVQLLHDTLTTCMAIVCSMIKGTGRCSHLSLQPSTASDNPKIYSTKTGQALVLVHMIKYILLCLFKGWLLICLNCSINCHQFIICKSQDKKTRN